MATYSTNKSKPNAKKTGSKSKKSSRRIARIPQVYCPPRVVVAMPDLSFFTSRKEQSRRYLGLQTSIASTVPARESVSPFDSPASSHDIFLQNPESTPSSNATSKTRSYDMQTRSLSRRKLFLSDTSSSELQAYLSDVVTGFSSSDSDQSVTTLVSKRPQSPPLSSLGILSDIAEETPDVCPSTPRAVSVTFSLPDSPHLNGSSSDTSSTLPIAPHASSLTNNALNDSADARHKPGSHTISTSIVVDDKDGKQQTICKGDHHIQIATSPHKRKRANSSEDQYYRDNFSSYKAQLLRQSAGPYTVRPPYYRPLGAQPYTAQQREDLIQALAFTMTFHNLRATAQELADRIEEENRDLWPQFSTRQESYELLLAECFNVLQACPFFEKHLEPDVFDVKKTMYSYNRNKDDDEERVEIANSTRAKKRVRSTRSNCSYKEKKVTTDKVDLRLQIDDYQLDQKFDRYALA
ncbi:hypothetical protein FRC03_011969 [Tulasnella sp. 419]|nr:hypothetical protein FRC03_011969 [Tulasnella sp. 419]